MFKKNKQETLADRIANDLNLVQASFDPEDENLDDTRAQLGVNFSEDNDDEEAILSQFRKQNVALLADLDERYAGKKGRRKSVDDFDGDYSESDEESEADVAEESDADSITKESQGSNDEQSEERESDEQDEAVDGSAEDKTDESISDEIGDGSVDDETDDGSSVDDEMEYGDDGFKEEDNFKHFKDTNVSSQMKKGLCVKNQMKMWESLLETRIQLQKCLITANKMPQREAFNKIKSDSGQEFSNQVAITKNSLCNVLDKLMLLQKLVLKKYPETKGLDKNKQKVTNEDDDEEIASDTEEEKSAEESEDEEEDVPKKKRKLNELEKEINEQHLKYKKYRNSVIEKWNEKTRIAIMKNNANSHSVINHIEHTLSDRTKLVKRTQLKRSDYTILGQELPKEAEKQNEEEEMQDIRLVEEYNSEIFDDDDFYHQLLRELIEVKSADLTDPVQLGRQWIQLQNLRSKMKRKIDTRATKGRKIRYAVHKKLVNFMAPIDEYLWTDEAKTELYNSLFGKNQQFAAV